MKPAVLRELARNPKGNPLEVARIAGIGAAKKTSDLIPMCHPLMLTHIDVEVSVRSKVYGFLRRRAHDGADGREMEAMTAAGVAALTVYDMTKALSTKASKFKISIWSRRPAARAAISAESNYDTGGSSHDQRFGPRRNTRRPFRSGGARTAGTTGLAGSGAGGTARRGSPHLGAPCDVGRRQSTLGGLHDRRNRHRGARRDARSHTGPSSTGKFQVSPSACGSKAQVDTARGALARHCGNARQGAAHQSARLAHRGSRIG